mgnify:CR=1 FL=1
MNIQLDTPSSQQYFRHYEPGLISTNHGKHQTSIIVAPDRIITPNWAPQSFQELTIESFDEILELDIEVVLFGTGEKQHIPNNKIFKAFFQKGKSLDFMSSHAACRTFNILADEGRAVVSAILVK